MSAILEEYLSLITYGFTNPMSDSIEGPWKLTAKDIVNGRINFDTARKTTQYEYENFLTNKSRPIKNDILLTKDGTLGRVAIVEEDNICINQSVALLRPNNKILPKYLYYLLQAPKYQQIMFQEAHGSTIKHIYISKVGKMEVEIPSIEVQKQIVDILWNIDKKIDNICDNIKIHESVINNIYCEWFYKHTMLDSNKENSDCQNKDWRYSDVFSNVLESKEKNKEKKDYPVLSVVKEGVFRHSEDVFTKQVYSKSTSNYKIVKKNQVAYNPARANIGSIAMLKEHDVGLVSPIYVVFETKETITPTYFYYYMKQPMFLEGIKHHAIGTTRQNFPFEAFKMFPMVVPPMELQLEFEKIAKPIEEKIAKLKEENEVLAEIRDTLLPKLMNGEIPLEEGEK